MSYYKTIDGVKYDKSLLDHADTLIKGQGDGRISQNDIQELAKAAWDGQSITDIERATFHYITENYRLTADAKNWIAEQPLVIFDDKRFLRNAHRSLAEFGVDFMELRINPRVVEQMTYSLHNRVPFFEGLRQAVHIFLIDKKRDAPWYEVENIVDHFLGIGMDDLKDSDKWSGVVTGLLKERMNSGYLELLPIWEDLPEEERDELQIPDIDVSSTENWIFFLGIRTDDHQFFAIVDRKGEKPAYTYGYN